MGAEGGAAAAVAVDLLHSGADVIVAHVQHVEAGRRRRAQQGGAVQQRQAALCQSRLQKLGFFFFWLKTETRQKQRFYKDFLAF